jgi:hypothetical protein
MTHPASSLVQSIERRVIKTEDLIDRGGGDISHGHTGNQGNSSY